MTPKITYNNSGRQMTYERDGNNVTLRTTCPFCNKPQCVQVTSQEYYHYTRGELVQHAFPGLTPSQREVLVTGICDDCWNDIAKEHD